MVDFYEEQNWFLLGHRNVRISRASRMNVGVSVYIISMRHNCSCSKNRQTEWDHVRLTGEVSKSLTATMDRPGSSGTQSRGVKRFWHVYVLWLGGSIGETWRQSVTQRDGRALHYV